MERVLFLLSLFLIAGKKNSDLEFLNFKSFHPVVSSSTISSYNKTEERVEALEEVNNLHHLLNGYNSILYRFNINNGKKLVKIAKRPDRMQSKYSTEQAIQKLHQVDEIFPIYQNYFNVSYGKAETESLEEIIGERVQNIKNTLDSLEEFESSCDRNSMNLKFIVLVIIFCRILT